MQDQLIQELSEKVDKILLLLEGTKHNPGLLERVEKTEELLHGSNDSVGLVHKVAFMWRAHVWVIGGLGTGLGSILTYVLTHFIKP